jgi:glycosyltransferase involved in cell wall biosynthesis
MRIAQVAPVCESVPPRLYGGTERIVSYLTEELVRMGHDVVLYATGDSETTAELWPAYPRALRLDTDLRSPVASQVLMLEQVARDASSFDLIHFHVDCLHFPLARRLSTPHVTTLHGRLDLPDLVPLFDEFRDIPIVSISNSQRQPLPWAGWAGTVYHGLPADLYRFSDGPGDYFAFLGRISPEKRLDRAIDIAQHLGCELKIAAKIDRDDRDYFNAVIRPLLSSPGVELIGEIDEGSKGAFLGGARALLFPIDWPEPFGLVMIEALACGTPVVAFGCGSVPEVLEHGETGFICDSLAEARHAAANVEFLSRARCRAAFEDRFSVTAMTRSYLAVYERLIAARQTFEVAQRLA